MKRASEKGRNLVDFAEKLKVLGVVVMDVLERERSVQRERERENQS